MNNLKRLSKIRVQRARNFTASSKILFTVWLLFVGCMNAFMKIGFYNFVVYFFWNFRYENSNYFAFIFGLFIVFNSTFVENSLIPICMLITSSIYSMVEFFTSPEMKRVYWKNIWFRL